MVQTDPNHESAHFSTILGRFIFFGLWLITEQVRYA